MLKFPVAVLIAPDMGGPATAPIARMDMHIPTREPTSCTFPIWTRGAAKRPTNTPDEALNRTGRLIMLHRSLRDCDEPIYDCNSDISPSGFDEGPYIRHNPSDERKGYHDVEGA